MNLKNAIASRKKLKVGKVYVICNLSIKVFRPLHLLKLLKFITECHQL